jgi:hypothetical protein
MVNCLLGQDSAPPGWEIVTDGKNFRWRHNGGMSIVDRKSYRAACRVAWSIHNDNLDDKNKNWRVANPPNVES